MLKAINSNTLTFSKFRIALWLCHWHSEAFVWDKTDEDGKNKTIRGQGRKQRKDIHGESERCSACFVGKDRLPDPGGMLITR